jgi:hypothetical protein
MKAWLLAAQSGNELHSVGPPPGTVVPLRTF